MSRRSASAPRKSRPRAAIVAIGSEMLSPASLGHELPLADGPAGGGRDPGRPQVGRRRRRRATSGRSSMRPPRRRSLIFTTGGLGPTADDVTVAAVAQWLGVALERNAAFVAQIRARFAGAGPADARRQREAGGLHRGSPRAREPARHGAGVLGARDAGSRSSSCPASPRRCGRSWKTACCRELARRAGRNRVLRRRVLRIGGTGESAVEELVTPVYEKWKDAPGHDPRFAGRGAAPPGRAGHAGARRGGPRRDGAGLPGGSRPARLQPGWGGSGRGRRRPPARRRARPWRWPSRAREG